MRHSEIITDNKKVNDHQPIILLIGGCVDYFFGAGKGQTTFNFFLMDRGSIGGIDISPRVIPTENLILTPIPFGVYVK
jgi:hypothetical protein